MTLTRCPICRRSGWMSRDSLADHVADDHSAQVIAAELLNLVYPPEPAPTSAPVKPVRKPCGKRRYRTHEHALDALIKTALSKSPNRAERRAYQCRDCSDDWHLTKRDERP